MFLYLVNINFYSIMEQNYIEINYQNKSVKLLQYLSESNNQFNKRLEYIQKLEKVNVDWKDTQRLCKVWYCIKYKKCKYLSELYHKVLSYEK